VGRVALVDDEPGLAGMVAWALLEKGEAATDALDRLAEIPQVKGIWRIIWFEDDLEFCLRPGFVRGVRLLERYGFSFDICISHEHMANTITLVRRCPNIQCVLDHIGKPDIASGRMGRGRPKLPSWRGYPTCAASCPAWWPRPTISPGRWTTSSPTSITS
jgi:L-fuconolactonase